jgi:hypothetical protein
MEKPADQKRPERSIPVYFFFICDSSGSMGIPMGNSAVRPIDIINLAPSKILDKNKLEMRVCSVFLNKLSFDSKSTLEYCIKLRND